MNPHLTCFLIDDDGDDRDIFRIALKDSKIIVQLHEAVNGLDALQKLPPITGFIPDFIFLDLNMPVMGGKECLIKIRAIEKLKHIPVIIYSTSDYLKYVKETEALGASLYVVKPSSIEKLAQILASILRKEQIEFFLPERTFFY